MRRLPFAGVVDALRRPPDRKRSFAVYGPLGTWVADRTVPAMTKLTGTVSTRLTVADRTVVSGMATAGADVLAGGTLSIVGTVSGDVDVADGGTLEVSGTLHGNINADVDSAVRISGMFSGLVGAPEGVLVCEGAALTVGGQRYFVEGGALVQSSEGRWADTSIWYRWWGGRDLVPVTVSPS